MTSFRLLGTICGGAMLMGAATNASAMEPVHDGAHDHATAPPTTVCRAAGPQSPRDISDAAGENADMFERAPPSSEMNLCNVHFHKGAEHRSPAASNGYDRSALASEGYKGGHRCRMDATPSELKPVALSGADAGCEGVAPGDTIEVHWVFSTCNVSPGAGLGSCVLKDQTCKLRVESQVFLLVNDGNAPKFGAFDYTGAPTPGAKHQPRRLPDSSVTPVEYRGSTTNEAYNSTNACSPIEVSWRVRPECAKLDIGSLHAWCAKKANAFKESEGHPPRQLVTYPKFLSKID